MQVFTTRRGGEHLEETGREVKVALAIARRQSAQTTGAMPAAFGAMLQPQQVADVVAYLLQQKAKPSGFHLETQKDQVALWLDGKKIGTYLLKHPQLTRQAWINMKTHTGLQVTRNYPPQASDGADHPLMHPGIWMGFGHLDGQDYWRLQAKVLHDGYVQPPKVGPNHASITVRNRYQTADGKGEVSQEIWDGIPPAMGLLLWDSTFRNEQRDFYFGDQEESMARILTLRVKGGNGDYQSSWRKERAFGEGSDGLITPLKDRHVLMCPPGLPYAARARLRCGGAFRTGNGYRCDPVMVCR